MMHYQVPPHIRARFQAMAYWSKKLADAFDEVDDDEIIEIYLTFNIGEVYQACMNLGADHEDVVMSVYHAMEGELESQIADRGLKKQLEAKLRAFIAS